MGNVHESGNRESVHIPIGTAGRTIRADRAVSEIR